MSDLMTPTSPTPLLESPVEGKERVIDKATVKTDRYELRLGKAEEIVPLLDAGCVSTIICDPPYNTTQCDWDQPLDWPVLWPELWRVCDSKSSPVVLFSAQPFTTDLICSQRKQFRYEVIWSKSMGTGFLDANRRPLRAHENILLFCQGGRSTYNAQKTEGHSAYFSSAHRGANVYGKFNHKDRSSDGDRYPKSVIEFGNSWGANRVHPTEKPVDLMEWLIQTYSNPGDTILDFTMGSGSTLVAAMNCGRRAIGIESDLTYFNITCERLEVATGQFATKEDAAFGGLFAP